MLSLTGSPSPNPPFSHGPILHSWHSWRHRIRAKRREAAKLLQPHDHWHRRRLFQRLTSALFIVLLAGGAAYLIIHSTSAPAFSLRSR